MNYQAKDGNRTFWNNSRQASKLILHNAATNTMTFLNYRFKFNSTMTHAKSYQMYETTEFPGELRINTLNY